MPQHKTFVVQSQLDVSQFSSLDIALKHAALNSPATVFRGEDVSKTTGKLVYIWAGSQPVARTW